MKRVNLNFNIKDLDGKVIEEAPKASTIIGNALLQSKNEDSIKVMEWALQLGKSGELDLDSSDYEKFKKAVKGLDLPVITKGPVEIAINEAKQAPQVDELKKSK